MMSLSEFDVWAMATVLGRRRFVLRYGVLGWGVPTAILFALIQAFIYGHEFLPQLLSALVLFPISGIFLGYFMWKRMEQLHSKPRER